MKWPSDRTPEMTQSPTSRPVLAAVVTIGARRSDEMIKSRLGPIGIAIAIFVLISLILSAFFCTFPWSITRAF